MEKVETAAVDYQRRVKHREEWRQRLKNKMVELDDFREEMREYQGNIPVAYGLQIKDADFAVHKANLLLRYAWLCLDTADIYDYPGANLGPEPADDDDDQTAVREDT